jgi:sporulation protein YlmC with PRC-barrel domain
MHEEKATMIRNLLATTALATLVATAAYAQQEQTPAPATTEQPAAPVVKADGFLATNIIGESVYNGTGDDAQNIGDVNDMVLDKDGKVAAVVVGVGGFLGIGERNVAVDFTKLSWAENASDRWLVYPATKEQLEALPEFDRAPYDMQPATTASNDTGTAATTTEPMAPAATDTTAQAPATEPAAPATTDTTAQAPATEPAAPSTDTTAQAPATEPAAPVTTEEQAAANNQPAAEQPATTEQQAAAPAATETPPAATDTTTTAAIDKSQLQPVPSDQLSADNLIGTTVYGSDDNNIGEINDIVLNKDGKVDAVVIDVGGFLGMGEKPVAVGFDNLQFMTDKDGNKYLYTNLTKEQLDQAIAYDKGTYADQRDKQRVMVQ